MKNSKKILSLSMAATMLAGSTTAFAMPADVIVLGDKAFEILALSEDNAELQAEINAALAATDAEGMFYRLGSTGDFINLSEDDVVMTAAQQTALKNVVLTKADGTKETYANFEDESGTVVEQADLTAYNTALNAVKEADYTAESWTEYQKVVAANVVTVSNTQAEVDAAKDAIVAAQGKLVSAHALAVESVTALNLKQVKVMFNKVMDKTLVETDTNYEVYNDGSTTKIAGTLVPKLQEDNKTVILTLVNDGTTALTNLTTAKVVVKKAIKDVDGNALTADYVNAAVSASDLEAPTVVSITQSAPNKIKVLFNEPMNDGNAGATIGLDNFKVDNGAYIVSAATSDLNKNTVELTLSGNLSTGDHTLMINPVTASDLVDFAGFEVAKASETAFSVTTDTVAPTVTVKEASQTSVTFKFNERVTGIDNANVAYRHSVNGTQYEVLGNSVNVSVDDTNDWTEVTVNFASAAKPLPAGDVTLFIAYKSTTATKITDVYNNAYVAASYSASVGADTTAPTATVAMVTSSNTAMDVTFSEAVTGADVAANYTLKNAAGTTVTFTGAPVKQTGNVYRLTASSALSGSYTLEIKNIKDTAVVPNAMATTTLAVSVTDTIKPFITENDGTTDTLAVYTLADAKHVRVYFSESMNTTDLADLTKYQNKADSNANPTAVEIAADGKSVILTFAANVTDSSGLIIGQMRDVAGNMMTDLAKAVTKVVVAPTIGLKPLTAEFTKNVVALDQNTVDVYLNDVITSISAADFQVELDGDGTDNDWVTPSTVTVRQVDGKSVVTLKLSDLNKIPANQWATASPHVRTGAGATAAGAAAALGTKNSSGVAVEVANTTDIADMIVPTLATTNAIQTVDADGNGKIDHIKLTFTENMNMSFISADKFTVEGYTVTDAFPAADATGMTATARATTVVNDEIVYVTVTEKTTADGSATPKVTIATGLKDIADNAYAGLSDATVSVDKVAPVLVSAATSAGDDFDAPTDTLTLTFSENIAFGDELTTSAATLAVINDFLLVDYDGGTGDEAIVDAEDTITYTPSISGQTLTITLGGTGTVDEAMTANTDLNIVDLSNIVDTATTPNESVAAAADVDLTMVP